MHDICPFAKNPCRENLYSAKREQFICAKNSCLTYMYLIDPKVAVTFAHVWQF